MAMTRKDYVAIAARMKQVRHIQEPQQWQRGMAFLMIALHEINHKFNSAIFRKACGATPEDDAQIEAMYRLMGGS